MLQPQLPKKHNCLGISERGSHSAYKSISFKSEEIDFLSQDNETQKLKSLKDDILSKNKVIIKLEKCIQDMQNQVRM